MRKKLSILLVLLIVSLISFGCDKSKVSSSENTSTASDISQQGSDESSQNANQDKSQQNKNEEYRNPETWGQ